MLVALCTGGAGWYRRIPGIGCPANLASLASSRPVRDFVLEIRWRTALLRADVTEDLLLRMIVT